MDSTQHSDRLMNRSPILYRLATDNNFSLGKITSYKNYPAINKTREKLLIYINNECTHKLRNNKNQLKLNHKTPEQIAQILTYEKYIHLGTEKFTPNDLNRNRREQGVSQTYSSNNNVHNNHIRKSPFTKMSDFFYEQISPPNFNRRSLGRRKIIRFSKLIQNIPLFQNFADKYNNNENESKDDSIVSSSLSSLSEESGSGFDELGSSTDIEEIRDNKLKKQGYTYLQMVVRHIKRNKKSYHHSCSSKIGTQYDINKYVRNLSPIHRNKKQFN